MRVNMYDEFEKFSIETWEKITNITPLTTYLKINEEGFTLDLIYLANKLANTYVILDGNITDNEPTTGADFFWKIKCNNKIHNLAVQAKRTMKPSSNYNGIRKKIARSNNLPQIELLIKYAKGINYEPYYFFYNGSFVKTVLYPDKYVHTDEKYSADLKMGNIDMSKLGCTVLHADHVNNLNMDRPRFDRVMKNDNTRSLQQFFKDLCSTCGLSDNYMYETLNDKVSDIEYASQHSFFYKEIGKGYYILGSKEYINSDFIIEDALNYYTEIKRKTENLNKETNSIKYSAPKAILFTSY